jgi:hypothetical protein
MLTAVALIVILGGLAGAIIGVIGFQAGVDFEEELTIAGLVAGLVVLLVSFLIGGWTAGRSARYDGGKNGLTAALWTILLSAILAGLGAWFGNEYDVFRRVNLPQVFSEETVTAGAMIGGVVAIALMLIGGYVGGRWGERYHKRVDAAIVSGSPAATP